MVCQGSRVFRLVLGEFPYFKNLIQFHCIQNASLRACDTKMRPTKFTFFTKSEHIMHRLSMLI